jgi:serine/threonine protein kinase
MEGEETNDFHWLLLLSREVVVLPALHEHLAPSLQMDKYVVEKVIGEGTYGVVYKAVEKVGTRLTLL